MLLAGHQIDLVWADAGFFVTAFVLCLEARDLPYIIVARLTPLVRKVVIHRIPEADWRPIARGIAVADAMTALPAWRGQTRRVVCLRQTLTERPEASGRRRIKCPGYTYRKFVTSVPYAAELVTRMYAGRADSENRIKELKEDLSLDTFCLQAFDATDAALRTGCALYNLLMGFGKPCSRRVGLDDGCGPSEIGSFSSGRIWFPKPDASGRGSPSPVRSMPTFSPGCGSCSGASRLRRSWSIVEPISQLLERLVIDASCTPPRKLVA